MTRPRDIHAKWLLLFFWICVAAPAGAGGAGTWGAGGAEPAGAGGAEPPELSIRQNHLLFQFGHEDGRMVCAVQEIVVVESSGSAAYENPAGTVRLSVPVGAQRVSPAPVPDMMPGSRPDPELRADEIEISEGQILVKRALRPGKNTFSYAYLLFADDDAVRLEKKVFVPIRLLAAFAPKVRQLTSKSLQVETSADGYKILGHNLPAGTLIDLTFDGVHSVLEQEPRRDGTEMQSGASSPAGSRSHTAGSTLSRWIAPSVSGILLAVILFLYISQMKKTQSTVLEIRRFLMDEIELLDAAAENKEIPAEYYRRKKKALMDRMRLMP